MKSKSCVGSQQQLWQAAGLREAQIRLFALWQRTEQDKHFSKVVALLAKSAVSVPAKREMSVSAVPAITFRAGR